MANPRPSKAHASFLNLVAEAVIESPKLERVLDGVPEEKRIQTVLEDFRSRAADVMQLMRRCKELPDWDHWNQLLETYPGISLDSRMRLADEWFAHERNIEQRRLKIRSLYEIGREYAATKTSFVDPLYEKELWRNLWMQAPLPAEDRFGIKEMVHKCFEWRSKSVRSSPRTSQEWHQEFWPVANGLLHDHQLQGYEGALKTALDDAIAHDPASIMQTLFAKIDALSAQKQRMDAARNDLPPRSLLQGTVHRETRHVPK